MATLVILMLIGKVDWQISTLWMNNEPGKQLYLLICHLHPVLLYKRLEVAELLLDFLNYKVSFVTLSLHRKNLLKVMWGNEGLEGSLLALSLISKLGGSGGSIEDTLMPLSKEISFTDTLLLGMQTTFFYFLIMSSVCFCSPGFLNCPVVQILKDWLNSQPLSKTISCRPESSFASLNDKGPFFFTPFSR